MQTFSKEYKTANTVATIIARFLVASQKNVGIASRKKGSQSFDYTTHQDLTAEQMAIRLIHTSFPNDLILSEETLSEINTSADRFWIVDPIDGTSNYRNGLPMYAISISLYEKGKIRVAAICLPAQKQLYSAMRGKGVILNGKKLHTLNPRASLKESMVALGFPHQRRRFIIEKAFRMHTDILLACADVRRTGSAVLDTALVASGNIGAYITPDIKPWDIAAGLLFVEEMGGMVSDMYGKPLNLFKKVGDKFSIDAVFAKNKTIHTEMIRITRKYSPTRKGL